MFRDGKSIFAGRGTVSCHIYKGASRVIRSTYKRGFRKWMRRLAREVIAEQRKDPAA